MCRRTYSASRALAGVEEGVEVNLLGLTFGVDSGSLSIKLPIVGRLGPGRNAKPTTLDET